MCQFVIVACQTLIPYSPLDPLYGHILHCPACIKLMIPIILQLLIKRKTTKKGHLGPLSLGKYILEHVTPNKINYLTGIILRRGCQARVFAKANFPAIHFSHQQHKVKLVAEFLMHRSPLSMGD